MLPGDMFLRNSIKEHFFCCLIILNYSNLNDIRIYHLYSKKIGTWHTYLNSNV